MLVGMINQNRCDTHYFLDPKSFQAAYKCVKVKLPRANTLLFEWDEKLKKMTYTTKTIKDRKRFYLSGYVSTDAGDSGSPLIVDMKDEEGEDIYTFVAVLALGEDFHAQIPGSILTEERYECRNVASKLTPDVLNWIKKN